ncbi:hypothetical protein [Achromobacter denitrificans]|uniref:hypothetical protein n=1 Tax=Achromobacter denitrificans TaxID=32002 RepID=UPI003B9C5FDD
MMENPFRETLEDLLTIWYHWTAAQRPHLGNARCSPMFRDARPAAGNVHDDDEVVDRLRAFKARAMDHLIDRLPRWEHRVSVELHVANRIGPRVWRNARLTPEQLAEYWEEARYLLGAGCIDAGLLEEADLHPCVARGLAHREIRQ